MAVIHPFNATTPNNETYSRLFLREDELQFGLAAIFEVASALKNLCAQDQAKFDLNWAEAKAIITIGAKADTVLNLGHRLAVTKQAFTKTLRNLEKRKILARIDDPRDKRRKIVSLTELGREIERDFGANMRTALAHAYRNVGADAVYGSDQVLWSLITAPKSGKGNKL
jgi:DNA-binding MarR family transcriptional regulator